MDDLNNISNKKYLVCLLLLLMITMLLPSCGSGGKEPLTTYKKDKFEIAFEDSIKKIIEDKGNPDGRNEVGVPLLVLAANNHYVDVVKILLENGADVNIKVDKIESNALHAAITSPDLATTDYQLRQLKKDYKIMQLLIQHGILVNAKDGFGCTPLYKSAGYGRHDLCKLLIENGALVNSVNDIGHTPLHYAAKEGYWKVVEVLIGNGTDVNSEAYTYKKETPLFFAKEREDDAHAKESRKLNKDFFKEVDYDKTIRILKENGAH